MESYFKKLSFEKVKTYPVKERTNKVSVIDFSDPENYSGSGDLSALFPAILKGKEIQEIAHAVVEAKGKGKPVILALGAHVIKCGLSLLIIDLMKRGVVTSVAMNGAGAIHDYEIAFLGETSEDVAVEIKEGRFGMVEETGSFMNEAFLTHVNENVGMGEALGRDIIEKDYPHSRYSIMAAGYNLKIPVTIHSAIGTEIIHMHPQADGKVLGQGTFNDFQLFTGQLCDIGEGGVFFNIGSAVILPEVFLKSLSIVRNMGHEASRFTTVNFDMISQYRPLENVVNRPIQGEGKGYNITGHHEILVPLLYNQILNRIKEEKV